VDSSAQLEYVAGAGDFMAPAIEDKRVLQQRSENEAIQAAVHMQQGVAVPLDAELAMTAAKLSQTEAASGGQPHSRDRESARAILWTQDAHFEGLEGIRFRPRMA